MTASLRLLLVLEVNRGDAGALYSSSTSPSAVTPRSGKP
jgi:hypothetical protein